MSSLQFPSVGLRACSQAGEDDRTVSVSNLKTEIFRNMPVKLRQLFLTHAKLCAA